MADIPFNNSSRKWRDNSPPPPLSLLICEVYGGVDDERARDRERAREEREQFNQKERT